MNIAVRLEGAVAVLDLEGKLTAGDGNIVLRKTIDRLLEEARHRILLNLEKVPYMDSAGIGELVSSANRLSAVGGVIKLLNPLKRVYDVLHLVKLTSVFEVYHEDKAAIASFEP
jgi:anti-sigma B factor antagonist